MDRLTDEEVMHVADLARLYISEEEKDKYARDLKLLLDEVDKIKDINDNDADFLIAPIDHDSVLREDNEEDMLNLNELKDNIPSVKGNFVEVPVMLNE